MIGKIGSIGDPPSRTVIEAIVVSPPDTKFCPFQTETESFRKKKFLLEMAKKLSVVFFAGKNLNSKSLVLIVGNL